MINSTSKLGKLATNEQLQVDAICTRFECAWKKAPNPKISKFVDLVPSRLQPELAEELVHIDCELTAACGDMPTLTRYLEQLKQWPEQAKSGFVRWIDANHNEQTKQRDASVNTKTPTHIGDYRIIRMIGSGGMGIVYEAVQESLNRRVAIKTLPNVLLERHRVRFIREARTVAMLHHTNIIEIYGSGVDNGIPYFAMQLVDGKSLNKIISNARRLIRKSTGDPNLKTGITPEHQLLGRDRYQHIARVGIQVSQALAHAHQQGVLHRDIKPSNLLVDKDGTTFVSDFGLAKLADDEDMLENSYTGNVVGTLRYLPPESVVGTRDERSDIYSLGLTLYEILALQPAFTVTEHVQLLDQIVRGKSPESLRAKDPSIPADLDTIVMKALSSEPGSRYQSASEMAEDLNRFLEGRPILARPTSTLERITKWARRSPAAAALLSLVAMVILVVFPLVTYLWLTGVGALDLAERRQQKINQARIDAEIAKENAEKLSYSTSMQLAQDRLDAGLIEEARRVLKEWAPTHPVADSTEISREMDRRGWEWHYLNEQLDTSAMTLRSHHQFVWDVKTRPDGKQIASVHNGDPSSTAIPGNVTLWNTSTGQREQVLLDHGAPVFGCAYSSDSRTLATIGLNLDNPNQRGTICLWDPQSGDKKKQIELKGTFSTNAILKSTKSSIPAIRFSPDDKELITEYPCQIRDATTLEPIESFPDTTKIVSIDKNKMLTFQDMHLTIFDRATGKKGKESNLEELDSLSNFSSSSDGKKMLAVQADKQIVRFWPSAQDLSEYQTISISGIDWGRILPNGEAFVYSNRRGEIFLRPLNKSSSSIPLRGHESTITKGDFSPDAKHLVTASMDGTVKIWNLDAFQTKFESGRYHAQIADIAFTNNGQSLAFTSRRRNGPDRDKFLELVTQSLDAKQSTPKAIDVTLLAHWPRTDFAFNPDGSFVAAPTSEASTYDAIRGYPQSGEIGIWNVGTGKELVRIDVDMELISSVAWSEDSKLVAVGGIRGFPIIRVYQVDSKAPTLVGDVATANRPNAIAFRNNTLAAASLDNVETWTLDPESKKFNRLNKDDSPGDVRFLDISPDGQFLAAADHQREKFKVFRIGTGKLCFEQSGPRKVCCIRYSPDGSRLAVSGYDSLVYFCDAENGNRLLTLKGAEESPGTYPVISRTIFSPDGTRIATNNWRGEIVFWQVGEAYSKQTLSPAQPPSP